MTGIRSSLTLGDPPQDFSQVQVGAPVQILRPVRLKLTNHAMRWPWMTRDPAMRCKATIIFRHLNDGQNVFGSSMDGRWTNSPEPTPIEVSGRIPGTQGDQVIRLHMVDPTKITLVSRIDVHAGESQSLDVAARFDQDSECYGWNNESYFHGWRNQKWSLDKGRYLVEVTVTSSGQICKGLFRLINDVARPHFRLEDARPEDHAKIH
jgi:hypothetical protein